MIFAQNHASRLTNNTKRFGKEGYYPAGMLMPGRSYTAGDECGYRFGFNGKENVDEINGEGNSVEFGARILDPRLGRWLSLDPLQMKYPELSPYSFAGNNPIRFIDFDGKDFGLKIDNDAKTIIAVSNVYTISGKTYDQAKSAASLWNKKSVNDGGYTITFQVKVHPPVEVSDKEAIMWNPSIKRRNGKVDYRKMEQVKSEMSSMIASYATDNDKIGNTYSGNMGEYSKTMEVIEGGTTVGGVTANQKYISMNTFNTEGDIGSFPLVVGHEFGHLFGLDDEGGNYYSPDGIMKYAGLSNVSPPSDNDVKNIIRFAKDKLSGTHTKGANVSILENKGKSDGSNPTGVKNE